ncbi:MAG: ribosome-associated translation inhibitor RaiA [Candidatus Curtissbacteria bacterium]|nr:ribosome-associated translation inhibitor RaiA [Candidatus Curtissbacteria bacterium]
MNIIISGIHFEDFPETEDYAKEKVSRLSKYHSKIEKIEVRLSAEKSHRNDKHDFSCEIRISIPGDDLEVIDYERSIDKAIDKAVERIKRVLVKNKERQVSLQHNNGVISKLRRIKLF